MKGLSKNLQGGVDQDGSEIAGINVPASATGLVRLGLKGTLLMVLSAGLYRFWFVTQLRNYFWRKISILGFPLEYTGHPLELIAGFCIVIAVLFPLYLMFFILSLGLEHLATYANIAAFFILWFLTEYAVFQARRYRLTRTLYRGLHFNQSAQAAKYAALSMAWWLAVLASLGWLWPMRRRALQAYRISHTNYGDFAGSFSCSVAPLYKAAWPLLACFTAIAAVAVLMAVQFWQDKPDMFTGGFSGLWESQNAQALVYLVESLIIDSAVLLVLGLAAIAAFGPRYTAAEFREFAQATAIGPVRFRSKIRAKQLFDIWVTFAGVLVLCSVVYWAIGLGLLSISVRHSLASTMVDDASVRYAGLVVLGLFYLVGISTYSIIHLVLCRFALWRAYANSLEILGADNIEDAQRHFDTSARKRDGWSEGLADALDAGGF